MFQLNNDFGIRYSPDFTQEERAEYFYLLKQDQDLELGYREAMEDED